jgi:hypothetical protein
MATIFPFSGVLHFEEIASAQNLTSPIHAEREPLQ